ncbi:hypothetical protein LTR17_022624 [Elasticomyces elasticus]|nr:hypothetical protein LTR17_022624 [Elasticomyces elasticus]
MASDRSQVLEQVPGAIWLSRWAGRYGNSRTARTDPSTRRSRRPYDLAAGISPLAQCHYHDITFTAMQRALFLLASPGPAKLLAWVPNPFATLPGYLHEKRQLTFFFEPQMLLTHTAGIWQNMQVTQPPATEVALHYSIERSIDNDYTEVHGVARNSQGVTIGDILNRINITVEKLRKKSEFKLPKVTDYTEQLRDVKALDLRLRTRFIEKLEFRMMLGTARDCVCCESAWVMDGYRRMAEAAAAAALDAGLEKPTEEGAGEAMDGKTDRESDEDSW